MQKAKAQSKRRRLVQQAKAGAAEAAISSSRRYPVTRRLYEASFVLAVCLFFSIAPRAGRSDSFRDLNVSGEPGGFFNSSFEAQTNKKVAILGNEKLQEEEQSGQEKQLPATVDNVTSFACYVTAHSESNVCYERSLKDRTLGLESNGICESDSVLNTDSSLNQNEEALVTSYDDAVEDVSICEDRRSDCRNGLDFGKEDSSAHNRVLNQINQGSDLEDAFESNVSTNLQGDRGVEKGHSDGGVVSNSPAQVTLIESQSDPDENIKESVPSVSQAAHECAEDSNVQETGSQVKPAEAKDTKEKNGISTNVQIDEQNQKSTSLISNGEFKNVSEETGGPGSSQRRSSEDKESHQESVRTSRVTTPQIGEFKKKTANGKDRSASKESGTLQHKLDSEGNKYNYALASNGAKVLAYNKEVKGAPSILVKDKDKYLRNPCSAEEKFVVIELSQETLFDTVAIANFEHYSSNLKDFELLSSSVYPTDDWTFLGQFSAENVKNKQIITLKNPQLARYLKLRFLSHYGSEFFCTLSIVEVYGVDVVEQMLKDMMNEVEQESGGTLSSGNQGGLVPGTETLPAKDNSNGSDASSVQSGSSDTSASPEDTSKGTHSPSQEETSKVTSSTFTKEMIQQGGRLPGDTVLKILLEKVKALEINRSVLEKYLDELNLRYTDLFSDFDKELAQTTSYLRQMKADLNDLSTFKMRMDEETEQSKSWSLSISQTLIELAKTNEFLSSEIQKNHSFIQHMGNKENLAIFVSLIFGCVALLIVAQDILNSIFGLFRLCTLEKTNKHSSAWTMLLLSSSLIAFILSL